MCCENVRTETNPIMIALKPCTHRLNHGATVQNGKTSLVHVAEQCHLDDSHQRAKARAMKSR